MAQAHVFGHSLDQALHALTQIPSRVLLTIEGWRERSVLANELDALAAHGELDRTLLEAGLSPADVPRLLKGNPGAARQLPEMMRQVGIDPSTLPITQETREIEWRCTDCRTWRRCRDWLASSGADHGYLTFCPNGAALEQIRDRQEQRQAERDHPAVSTGVLNELDAMRGQIS